MLEVIPLPCHVSNPFSTRHLKRHSRFVDVIRARSCVRYADPGIEFIPMYGPTVVATCWRRVNTKSKLFGIAEGDDVGYSFSSVGSVSDRGAFCPRAADTPIKVDRLVVQRPRGVMSLEPLAKPNHPCIDVMPWPRLK